MSLEQTRVRLGNGIELDVVDEGPRDAPALIFLHGFPESHRTWRHQIAHFSDRYRCIAPDQRGYRGSSKPQEVEAYTPDKLIGDVFLLAAELGIDDFTIVGHDWGGAIAWGVALAGQKGGGTSRVSRCIIANAPHPAIFQKLLFLDPHQRESSQYMRGFRNTDNDDLVRENGLVGILMQEVKWDRSSAMEDEERARLLEDWQDRDAAFGMLNWYRASPVIVPPMDAPFEIPVSYQAPQLPSLTIPTLVIWAMDDVALPPGNLVGLEDIIDDLTVEQVQGCGHFVPWESPQKVNAAMEAFLAKTA
ncbi:alpha/beta fold hydrolase [Alteriqipengyuania lutimaris]|uniref:Alpha/beta hydrolase n=1 Tax=Alteriqipengyuania lutimaris TaxID=1538146 RepID=A0A395LLY1_9SPHN|nr:alpha/beta hydrolase [Alteriqipengyuania lutimaris]MBB3033234.1 pimeloyl-ACP methyl ester carboxylesterase [Alteriqipengyuania lutimaris]RDS77719.1 alpha/beta hydrolase [Alteriqipengyuania lutimaris]